MELADVDCIFEERGKFKQLLLKHADVLIQNSKDLGYTCSHHIWYSSHAALRKNFIIISRREDHTQKLLEDQIPDESYSSYASPIIVKEIANNCKKEKDESIRYTLCRDYRKQKSRLRDDLPLTKLSKSWCCWNCQMVHYVWPCHWIQISGHGWEGQVQNILHDATWTLWIPQNAIWIDQCICKCRQIDAAHCLYEMIFQILLV